uniref:Uncharacterized protein n=1 Tax=Timema monikensis TaxID=170555 RepID=A0A7R9HVA6_9NEOP|nr:unnamed protein product [Timema monikensis]
MNIPGIEGIYPNMEGNVIEYVGPPLSPLANIPWVFSPSSSFHGGVFGQSIHVWSGEERETERETGPEGWLRHFLPVGPKRAKSTKRWPYIGEDIATFAYRGCHEKTTLSSPDRYSNLDLPVIGSLVYCETSALDQAATKAVIEYGSGFGDTLCNTDRWD